MIILYLNNMKKTNIREIPFYIINLKRDDAKRLSMQKQCDSLGLKFHLLDAVDGAGLSLENISTVASEREAAKTIGRVLTAAEIGTALSHLAVYKQLLGRQWEYAVVLEDDVLIDSTMVDFLDTIPMLPKDWELILLGHHPERSLFIEAKGLFGSQTSLNASMKCVRFSEFPYGAYAYLINRSGATKLIQALQRISAPIDHYTGDEHFINLYGLTPICVSVNPALLKHSHISEERDRLNQLKQQKEVMPSWKLLVKNIPYLVKVLRKLQRCVQRFKIAAPYRVQ